MQAKAPEMPNDSLDNLFAGDTTADGAPKVQPPAHYQELKESGHFERCWKCRGSGQTRWGQCFACRGAGGKTFKTAPAQRAKARLAAADRKARQEQESVESFKAAHRAEYEWLVATAPRWELAASLLAGLHRYGSLTEKQMTIVTNGIARDAARTAERAKTVANMPAVDAAGVDRLKAAFDTAIQNARAKGRGLKMPRITIGGVVISPAKETSKNAGALYVKQAGQYLGKISGGRFFAAQECTADQQKKVVAFIDDPKAAAIAYGKETGVCCICNATLTNKVSIEAGIGPICGEKFGW
jgi:hypothetical protein